MWFCGVLTRRDDEVRCKTYHNSRQHLAHVYHRVILGLSVMIRNTKLSGLQVLQKRTQRWIWSRSRMHDRFVQGPSQVIARWGFHQIIAWDVQIHQCYIDDRTGWSISIDCESSWQRYPQSSCWGTIWRRSHGIFQASCPNMQGCAATQSRLPID